MTPIVSIVGRSKSGKTTLIERLIPELARRGYRVATIKHTPEDFEIDRKDKDSRRHKQAGAQTVLVASPQKVALIESVSHDLSPEELAERFIRGADIIVAEGFKQGGHPKVEVYRRSTEGPLAAELENLIAVVTDEPFQLKCPRFSFDDITGVANIIEDRVMHP